VVFLLPHSLCEVGTNGRAYKMGISEGTDTRPPERFFISLEVFPQDRCGPRTL